MTPEEITTLRDRIERRRAMASNWAVAVSVDTLAELLDEKDRLGADRDAWHAEAMEANRVIAGMEEKLSALRDLIQTAALTAFNALIT